MTPTLIPLPKRERVAGGRVRGKTSAVALALTATFAWAGEPVLSDVPLSKIRVVSIQRDGGLVEGAQGELTFVDVGDTLGEEHALVKRLSGNCLSLLTKNGPVTLCADGPQVPIPNT